MADTPDLGSGAERYAGSTPAPSTCDLIEVTRGQVGMGDFYTMSVKRLNMHPFTNSRRKHPLRSACNDLTLHCNKWRRRVCPMELSLAQQTILPQ